MWKTFVERSRPHIATCVTLYVNFLSGFIFSRQSHSHQLLHRINCRLLLQQSLLLRSLALPSVSWCSFHPHITLKAKLSLHPQSVDNVSFLWQYKVFSTTTLGDKLAQTSPQSFRVFSFVTSVSKFCIPSCLHWWFQRYHEEWVVPLVHSHPHRVGNRRVIFRCWWWLWSGPRAKAQVALQSLGLLYTLFSRSSSRRRQMSPRPTRRERSE
jgi:hypothetical protein